MAGAQLSGRVAPKVAIASPSECRHLFGSGRRLHCPKEFSRVFSSRLAVRLGQDAPFVVHYRLLNNGELSRLGIVVPKRYAKAATLRNAIKRQGREAFRLMADELPPCDLVLRLTRALDGIKSRDPREHKEWRMVMDNLLKHITTVLPS